MACSCDVKTDDKKSRFTFIRIPLAAWKAYRINVWFSEKDWCSFDTWRVCTGEQRKWTNIVLGLIGEILCIEEWGWLISLCCFHTFISSTIRRSQKTILSTGTLWTTCQNRQLLECQHTFGHSYHIFTAHPTTHSVINRHRRWVLYLPHVHWENLGIDLTNWLFNYFGNFENSKYWLKLDTLINWYHGWIITQVNGMCRKNKKTK